MNDASVKRAVADLLRNKDLICRILSRLKPEDLENGILRISQEILNEDLRFLIEEKLAAFLEEYQINFDHETIFLDCVVNVRQLGAVSGSFLFRVENFLFNRSGHLMVLDYAEKIHSRGNFLQNLAVKTAGLKGSYLKTIFEISNIPFIRVDENKIMINLDKAHFAEKIPQPLALKYEGCRDGDLILYYAVD